MSIFDGIAWGILTAIILTVVYETVDGWFRR